ncbi:BLUF domain-containing protein [uncultured Kriegella sp.]|uniref:BLUF domain-containing protein n=1 Tax=uncultured Kriegella sp. TaxID=1798910 RepID=UPI0030DC416C|tara:strand:+ start:28407 stop:28847 length:441 start_codon:yes stop_codon:yes gene_type:complete
MFELTYESQAIDKLTSVDIANILEEARSFNDGHDITGCLVFYNKKFIQILEGKRQEVQELYAKIKKDKRHGEVKLVSEDTIEERTFPKWGMAYYPISDENMSKSELQQFRANLKLLADFAQPTSATTLLFWKKVKLLVLESPDNQL